MVLDASPWMDEDEEDLRAMERAGYISGEELSTALEQIGFLNTTVTAAE